MKHTQTQKTNSQMTEVNPSFSNHIKFKWNKSPMKMHGLANWIKKTQDWILRKWWREVSLWKSPLEFTIN